MSSTPSVSFIFRKFDYNASRSRQRRLQRVGLCLHLIRLVTSGQIRLVNRTGGDDKKNEICFYPNGRSWREETTASVDCFDGPNCSPAVALMYQLEGRAS